MKYVSIATIVKVVAIIIFIFSINSTCASTSFSGEWRYVERMNTSEKPYSTFQIRLMSGNDGKIQGFYCFITQYGNRIDCDPGNDTINITGRIVPNTGSAEVYFYSFFGAKNGIAKISKVGDNLIWVVIKKPIGGPFFGPYKAKLQKTSGDKHQGERQVVIDRAYLYSAPSIYSITNTYVIKGDYVKLLNISDNLKFWKIRYKHTNGIVIERWIDCSAIDFCP